MQCLYCKFAVKYPMVDKKYEKPPFVSRNHLLHNKRETLPMATTYLGITEARIH